ncbi:hypothetical protein B7494_g19 [Chlorociboria aeruginascens]|nr:hypothetical protein B7494_g19 [Chlorociboria aeruginascens]
MLADDYDYPTVAIEWLLMSKAPVRKSREGELPVWVLTDTLILSYIGYLAFTPDSGSEYGRPRGTAAALSDGLAFPIRERRRGPDTLDSGGGRRLASGPELMPDPDLRSRSRTWLLPQFPSFHASSCFLEILLLAPTSLIPSATEAACTTTTTPSVPAFALAFSSRRFHPTRLRTLRLLESSSHHQAVMTSPYWGRLPPAKVTRQNSASQEEEAVARGKKLSIDTQGDRFSTQNSLPPQPGQNRISTQTEAPTLSTQSPFASPVATSFHGDGLAPRPPSFPYGASDTSYNKDYLDKRRRRESRNREFYDETSSEPPPAAPDAPRPPPPVSYKQPYSSGASASYQDPTRPRSTRRSEGPSPNTQTTPDGYYRTEPKGQYPPEAILRQGSARRVSNGRTIARNEETDLNRQGSERRGSSQTQPRKGSVTEDPRRRREWAPDRSPLQRLELTLDSITKEEKRARVEEAELLAREAKAGRGGERANQNSVRFRNRPVAKAPEPTSQPDPQSFPEAGLVRNLSSKQQKEQLQGSGTVEQKRPAPSSDGSTSPGFDYHQSRREEIPATEIPRRAPSSRNRSGIPLAVGAAGAIAAAGLGRSTSNKLKKEPTEEDRANRRGGAKEPYQNIALEVHGRGTAFANQPQSPKGKEISTLSKITTGPDFSIENRNLDLDLDSDDDMDIIPIRRGSSRKIAQLTGQAPPQNDADSPRERRVPGLVTANGAKYGDGPAGNNETLRNEHPGPKQPRHHHISDIVHHGFRHDGSGEGVYIPSRRLDEWKKGAVALLSEDLLDLDDVQTDAEKDKAWWEAGHTGRRQSSSRQRKAEAYDGEYDDSNTPTRFKPPLFLKSGPFLRYCGLRRERLQGRAATASEREIWRGSVMIVTRDSDSSYELAPTLRLFLQPKDILPPPPAQVDGEIGSEYVDPIAGLPKIGRDGRTLYIRPVEDLAEARDLSKLESDDGLFEMRKSTQDSRVYGAHDGAKSPKVRYKSPCDGETLGKYREVRGFRLHAEQGVTFWRFNIEVELRSVQQRIAYRINRGPATGFWVPARDKAMNIMFHSCNGFTLGVDTNAHCGPDPMWRDILNTHQTQPFHVMIGGGDQIYNDAVMEQTTLFKEWLDIKNPIHKEGLPLTPEIQAELETFYLERYCMWFSQGLFGIANSQIPMVNVFDDHDIIDGFGSYPHHYMGSPIMSGLGAIAFKFYMLFQQQSSIDEGEDTESSWLLGVQPGPYIPELSRSIFTQLGRSIAFLGIDCRTERMHDEIVSAETYHKIFDRLEKDIVKGETKHLIVLLGVPIAYPRMVWLENIFMSPIKTLGRTGILGKGLLNHFDGGVEVLDDLDDHWCAKHHKEERNCGDVHLAAIGQFYSNPKLNIPKHHDHRYMPNVISSAIVNIPPPDMLADLLNKRDKVHHLDAETDENMIPIFAHDVTGKPRNNKRLLNRRNWCSIRVYDPELSPPPTPQTLSNERSPSPPAKGGLFRRLSNRRGPSYRPDAAPPSSGDRFFSRRPLTARRGSIAGRPSTDSQRPGVLTRTLSLSRNDFMPGIIRRVSTRRKPDDGGINGYGADSDDEILHYGQAARGGVGMRGGSGNDDDYFSTVPRVSDHPIENAATSIAGNTPQPGLLRGQFHRTPTSMSQKQKNSGANQSVNLEGGLDICLNVEVNDKDPAGITMPYRLLVPALWYEETIPHPGSNKRESALKRLMSFQTRNKQSMK